MTHFHPFDTQSHRPPVDAWVERLAASECPALTTRRKRRAELTGASHDPIVWVEAQGANVVDSDGNRYVDLTSGFGVAFVGHRHPEVVEAVKRQADRLLHALGDLHPSDVKIRAARKALCASSLAASAGHAFAQRCGCCHCGAQDSGDGDRKDRRRRV